MRLNRTSSRRGFTLIELILVMALMLIMISLVTPQLEKFFIGRTLDSEVRQFVSLARYGQSRAVSEGIPMFLWVNPKTQTYGLRQETGYTDNDPKAEQFKMGDGLTIDVSNGTAKPPPRGQQAGIHFSPDGNIITSTSVAGVSIQQRNHPAVWIRPAANGLSYEVQNQNGVVANARH
jgi:prepilin-type N-terminal cleavage/methylation domain-containing protein